MGIYEISILENLRLFAHAMFFACPFACFINFMIYAFPGGENTSAMAIFHKKIILGIFVAIAVAFLVSVAIFILTPNAEAIEFLKAKAVSNG